MIGLPTNHSLPGSRPLIGTLKLPTDNDIIFGLTTRKMLILINWVINSDFGSHSWIAAAMKIFWVKLMTNYSLGFCQASRLRFK